MNAPFHPGELAAQMRAGVLGSGNAIRDYLPEQHREFFAGLPFALMATREADGRPRARVLHGAPGFISSPDEHTLRIAGASGLQPGAEIGLLGLDLSNRRRNRANGVVSGVSGGAVDIEVRQSFGNCPKYITLRDVRTVEQGEGKGESAGERHFAGLEERALVARADTFFIATSGGVHGVDISHRGGPAGFVGIEGDVLKVADFSGNRYFNTLGNLLLDARAALLFIDFDSGDVLELEGRASIVWEGERHWRFHTERGTMTRAALPLRWHPRP